MLPVGVLSWIALIAVILLCINVSASFAILDVLIGIYALVCTCLAISYGRLIRRMTK